MKGKEIALWMINGLVALVVLYAGAAKLTAVPEMVQNFTRWGFPLWFFYFIGAAEVLGGIGLLVPRTRFWAAALLVPILAGAVLTHLSNGESSHAPLPALLTLLLIGAAFARRDEKGRIFASGNLLTGV